MFAAIESNTWVRFLETFIVVFVVSFVLALSSTGSPIDITTHAGLTVLATAFLSAVALAWRSAIAKSSAKVNSGTGNAI